MEFVKLICDGRYYTYKEATSIQIEILGFFLKDIDACDKFIIDWAISNEEWAETYGTNTTFLEKDGETIFIEDTVVEKGEIPNCLEISRQQFIQLLDDWQEKVCIPRPKEVIIKFENDQYSIETSS